MWRNLGIPFIIHCTHFMHGFNLAIKEKLTSNLKIFSEVKAFCDELNGEYIIFHPGIEGSLKDSIEQIQRIKDKRLLVENKPYISMYGDRCRGSLYEELEEIAHICNIGFCLDIAHAINTAFHLKTESFRYLNKMLTLHPQVVHISDGKMQERHDRHLNIGDGDFNFKNIRKIILKADTKYLTVETCKRYNNLSDFVKDVKEIKELININNGR